MDTPVAPNPQVLARVKNTITPEFLAKLKQYALMKLRQKSWRGVWNGIVPGGVEADDLVMSAIEAVLIGDPERKGRQWDFEKTPDLMTFLRSVIDSKANHLAEKLENVLERAPQPADGESEADFLDRRRDHRTVPDGHGAISAEDEATNERLFFALIDEVKEDPLLPKILECQFDGTFERAEIAAKLSVDPNSITQAKKRLDRILPTFRAKHAQQNPFKSR